MSVNLTINGQTFAYPEVGDTDWGTSATLWATAATNGMLQKAGGTFTLLADVDFGATFGLVSTYYKTRTANLSSAGSLRLAQADSIGWRNNANSGNLLLSVSSDSLQFNGTSIPLSGLIVNADISPSAAIAYSKLNLATSIVNADISGSAAIAYSKLNLATSILNADISASAAIAYSKLSLTGSIVNDDISLSAQINGSKIFPQFGSQIVSGDREFQFTEIATPSPIPAANKVFIYPKSDGKIYKMDDTGTEAQLATTAEALANPMTTLGDSIYGAGSGVATRLAGNTTTTRNFLRQTGNGSVSAAPAWDTILGADVPLATDTLRGTINYYQTASVAANGDFTGGTITYTRIGNVVTVSTTLLTHASGATISCAAGFIPSWARPSDTRRSCYTVFASSTAGIIEVPSDGTLVVRYYSANGTTTNRTDSVTGGSITYTV